MNILPMLNGWQRIYVTQQFIDNQYVSVSQSTELYKYNGSGWLYSVDIVTDDPNMQLRVIVDGNVYKQDAYHLSVLNGHYGHFILNAYRMDYNMNNNNYVINEFGYSDSNGTPFNSSIDIYIIPSISTAHIFSYNIEFIVINNMQLFIQSFKNIYGMGTSTNSLPETPSQELPTGNLPPTQDLCL